LRRLAIVEIWETDEDGQNWFDENVRPNLPPDIVPNRTYFTLHTAFTKYGVASRTVAADVLHRLDDAGLTTRW
jgi:hypothetical protein